MANEGENVAVAKVEPMSRTDALRKAADDLCVAFDAQERELMAERNSLYAAAELVKKNAADLHEREQKVSRREQEVQNIRQIAAERKTQLQVAQESSERSDKLRREAETMKRLAESEKSRLEETVATLIREKRELMSQIEELRKNQEEVAAPK